MTSSHQSTVVVTGGSGFVGRHMLELLADADPSAGRVVVVDINPPTGPHDGFVECDLTDPSHVSAVFDSLRPTSIVHLAGVARCADLETYLAANVVACNHVLTAVARLSKRPRVLVVGSAAQYGIASSTERMVVETRPLLSQIPYGLSKSMQEHWALLRGKVEKIPVVCVRPFNIMGPSQPEDLVPATFLCQALEVRVGRADAVKVGNLSTSRDFLDVRDVCRALHALMGAPTEKVVGRVFNIASGSPLAIRELLGFCLELVGRVQVWQDPFRLKEGDVSSIVGDASLLRECTGWAPKITWQESVRDMWRDYRATKVSEMAADDLDHPRT